MKFSTDKEHRDFFQKHGWIEFEDMLSADQCHTVKDEIDRVLAERLKIRPQEVSYLPAEKLYMQGRDLWRASAILQKFAMNLRFVEIAVELVEKRMLRFGYDQFFLEPNQNGSSEEPSQSYTRFLKEPLSLQACSYVHGVSCGLMVSLERKENHEISEEEETISSEGMDIFPSKPGHVIYFQPNIPINWKNFYRHVGQSFYLIVYANNNAYYQLEPQDPHTHMLKRLGYVFNDKLNDRLHPIIFRG